MRSRLGTAAGALTVLFVLSTTGAQGQGVTVIFPGGGVALAHPTGPSGNLYIMHPDGRTTNLYALPDGAYSVVGAGGEVGIAYPHGIDTLIVTMTGRRPGEGRR
jgi:hypothetical protein